jgi:hypothetical protein
MTAPEPPLSGEELLTAITEAMVALHQRYHHRKPVTAATKMLGDDLLARAERPAGARSSRGPATSSARPQ